MDVRKEVYGVPRYLGTWVLEPAGEEDQGPLFMWLSRGKPHLQARHTSHNFGRGTRILGDGFKNIQLDTFDNIWPQPNLPQCHYTLLLHLEGLKGHSRSGLPIFFDTHSSLRLKMAQVAGGTCTAGIRMGSDTR